MEERVYARRHARGVGLTLRKVVKEMNKGGRSSELSKLPPLTDKPRRPGVSINWHLASSTVYINIRIQTRLKRRCRPCSIEASRRRRPRRTSIIVGSVHTAQRSSSFLFLRIRRTKRLRTKERIRTHNIRVRKDTDRGQDGWLRCTEITRNACAPDSDG